ncbi:MAG: M28 family peptidase [Desulfobacteraceae bacterium]|nr:M28 family peptidase [Desulfobacteraceae bacterium]
MSISDPMTTVRKLTSLPHRGAGTPHEKEAADIIENLLLSYGAEVERQVFKTPKTYIWEVIWLIIFIAAGLISAPFFSWFSVGILVFAVASSFLYFDWRSSPLSFFAPSVLSENITGKMKNKSEQSPVAGEEPQKRLILMAHYDSAPISLLYLPSMVKNFRSSLMINIFLIGFALFIAILQALNIGQPVVLWICFILAGYLLIQGVITSLDYMRYGYTNGASDNATGVAVAMATAKRLWENPVTGLDVIVVLTGAEETGMNGSKYYFNKNKNDFTPENTFVLNFDSIGKGDLKIITKTGSISTVYYKGALVDAALKTAKSEDRFNSVKEASWHTGDFDTIWFARAGIESLTLSVQDKNGAILNLHRPGDTIENIDESLPAFTISFAETLIRNL